MSDPLEGASEAHRALSHIYENYGLAGLDDEALLDRMLPDLMPAKSREARLLTAAASAKVGQLLTDRVAMNIPPDTAVRDVAALLADQAALDAAAGTWAVNQYATVLGYRIGPARLPSARATASVPVTVPVPVRAAAGPIYESTRTMTDTSDEEGEAPGTDEPAATKKPKRKGSFWRELPILLGAAVVVALLVRTFVVQTFYVPSDSMEHTLDVNDRVLVNKLVYDFRDPRRGEVIVFTAPQDWRQDPNETDFVKRVIGVPGDHVVCCNAQNQLVINGVGLAEPYIHLDRPDSDKASPEPFDIVVPPGRLWVMGDNRDNSADSRYHWVINKGDIDDATIPISSVIGRAFVLFWPVHRATWLNVPDGFSKIPDHPQGTGG